MSVLFYGMGLILIAFVVHLLLWRIHLPQNHTKVLLQIFFGTLTGGIFILWKFSNYIVFFNIPTPVSHYEYLQLSFLFISLTLSYIIAYSGIEADSPSLVMVMNIAKAGSKGLDKNSFEQSMDNNVLVMPRVRDLLAGGMIYLDNGVYKLKPKGIFIVRIFITYRRFLKRVQNGG